MRDVGIDDGGLTCASVMGGADVMWGDGREMDVERWRDGCSHSGTDKQLITAT